jgi:hypothetical protein
MLGCSLFRQSQSTIFARELWQVAASTWPAKTQGAPLTEAANADD